jgi:hypothetical protein
MNIKQADLSQARPGTGSGTAVEIPAEGRHTTVLFLRINVLPVQSSLVPQPQHAKKQTNQ